MSDSHKEAARLRGEARTAGAEARVLEAMVTIKKEMVPITASIPKTGGPKA